MAGPHQAGQVHTQAVLLAIYEALYTQYGPQRWWPTRTGSRWEIMLGAVLTQRTSWRNVEKALANILSAWGEQGLSDPACVLRAHPDEAACLLKPAGHFNSKPRKLKLLAEFVLKNGWVDAPPLGESAAELRRSLLGIWGIGPETADAILLYALDRPIFVADAYALRLASRWGLTATSASYDEIQRLFMDNLPHNANLFNEYHALIVAHGKDLCRPRPLCEACPLNRPIVLERTAETSALWQCPKLYTTAT